jgi:hypothetical protein
MNSSNTIVPDYTAAFQRYASATGTLGQVNDAARLDPLSLLYQNSFIPRGDIIPGGDFLGVGYDPRAKYATWENAKATLFQHTFFEKRNYEGFSVPDNIQILGVWRTVVSVCSFQSWLDDGEMVPIACG